ncbi:MAG TPA: hypothetical protein VFB52_02945 [Solirubrobacterales bacterium]|nr:hypothetical protein [Solirubrobacterales bacterium]
MRLGLRTSALAIAATAMLSLALPAGASATKVGFTAIAEPASECFPPKGNKYASTSCQVFLGNSLEIIAVASRDDGSVRLAPQPFTLLRVNPGNGTTVVTSFTLFDENEADDQPIITPRRNTDYKLRFNGNEVIPAETSAPLVVEVGAELSIPEGSSTGSGKGVGIPVGVTVPDPSLRGKLELRRCHRTKAFSAASCARPSSYTVLSRRAVNRSDQLVLSIAVDPRSYERYEIAFRPRSRQFATTRQAFNLSRAGSGPITYRQTVRASPFGNR